MVQSALTPENENQEQVTFKWEKVHFLYGLFIFISFWPQHMSYHCEVTFKVSHSCRTRMFSYMILDHSMVQIALKDSRIWIKSQENNRVVHIHHLSLMFLQHLSLRFLGCFFFFLSHQTKEKQLSNADLYPSSSFHTPSFPGLEPRMAFNFCPSQPCSGFHCSLEFSTRGRTREGETGLARSSEGSRSPRKPALRN